MSNVNGLSGGQIDWLLNNLLEKALTPLAKSTLFVRQMAGELLCQPFNDLRRKISSASTREKAGCSLFCAACSTEPEAQIFHFMAARVERNLTHASLLLITSNAKAYRQQIVQTALSKKASPFVDAFNRKVGGSHASIFNLLPYTVEWVREYENLRNSIVMQFEGLARSQTDQIVRGTILAIDYDDMYKNMMLGVQRAVDKYSSERGTLVSYVQMWMRDAHTNPKFQHEYGNSFVVSAGERRRISNTINSGEFAVSNLSVTMEEASMVSDTLTPEMMLLEENLGIMICKQLLKIPSIKLAFLTQEVPFFLSRDQKALLEATL